MEISSFHTYVLNQLPIHVYHIWFLIQQVLISIEHIIHVNNLGFFWFFGIFFLIFLHGFTFFFFLYFVFGYLKKEIPDFFGLSLWLIRLFF